MTETSTSPQEPQRARWFWQRRLQYRLMLAFGLLFLAVLTLLMLYVLDVVYETQLNQAEHDLEIESFLIANALEDPLSGYAAEFERYEEDDEDVDEEDDEDHGEDDHKDEDHEQGGGGESENEGSAEAATISQVVQTSTRVQQLVEWYADDAESRVTILDASGAVVADSHHPSDQVSNQATMPEVEAALQFSEQHDIRSDEFTDERTLYAAAPIQLGNNLLGVVRLARPMSEVLEPIRNMLASLIVATLGATLLVMVLAVWLSRYLVRPLRSLEETAHAVGEGNFDQRTRVMTPDEIGTVAIAFNDMVERLQRLVQGQRLFIANASHELRTPLTNIKLRSEALIDLADGEQSEEDLALTRRYIEEIDSEADRLSRLANTLLDLSRLDSLDRKPATEGVDLAPLLHSIANSIQLRVEQSRQTFDVSIPETLPLLHVWPDQIETIVLNLLDNAIKYTPPGGTIGLKADISSQHCRLRVEDTGPGIPTDELPQIFGQFYRVDKARSRQETGFGVGSGAGLGLSLIKTLVERNGGAISVESELGRGSVFTVLFSIEEVD